MIEKSETAGTELDPDRVWAMPYRGLTGVPEEERRDWPTVVVVDSPAMEGVLLAAFKDADIAGQWAAMIEQVPDVGVQRWSSVDGADYSEVERF